MEANYWKQALWKKYFTRSRRRSLDLQPKVNNGSHIFKLIIVGRRLITRKFNWIPGNGHLINYREDKILEFEMCDLVAPLLPLWGWLESQGMYTLADLSSWSRDGTWKSSINLCPHTQFAKFFNLFISSLQGCAPRNERAIDTWGWIFALYTIKRGYILLVEAFHNHPWSN